MALAACLLGYGEVGLWLKKEATKSGSWVKLNGNAYLRWIEDYSGETYQAAVKLGLGTPDPCSHTLRLRANVHGDRNDRDARKRPSTKRTPVPRVVCDMGEVYQA